MYKKDMVDWCLDRVDDRVWEVAATLESPLIELKALRVFLDAGLLEGRWVWNKVIER